jgi:hypothetical protein
VVLVYVAFTLAGGLAALVSLGQVIGTLRASSQG